jgi:hypothetical protein
MACGLGWSSIAIAKAYPLVTVDGFHYGWSVVSCLPGAMGDPQTAATGAVLRVGTLRRYAREAGFRARVGAADRDGDVAVLSPLSKSG